MAASVVEFAPETRCSAFASQDHEQLVTAHFHATALKEQQLLESLNFWPFSVGFSKCEQLKLSEELLPPSPSIPAPNGLSSGQTDCPSDFSLHPTARFWTWSASEEGRRVAVIWGALEEVSGQSFYQENRKRWTMTQFGRYRDNR